GFANGALKHYFPGKDDIIKGAYERSLHRMGDALTNYVGDKRGIEAIEMSMRITLPVSEEDATAARTLLSFWERCAFNTDLDHDYGEHLTTWSAGYRHYIQQGREDGDIVTQVSDEQLVSEIILMNIGATVVRV